MQQADGWQKGWRDPEFSALPGRAPWLEMVARRDVPETGRGTDSAVSESLASLVHDTRNMVASMDLYCDLLEAPGVLAAPFRHYAGELRLVAGGSRRLLEKVALLAGLHAVAPELTEESGSSSGRRTQDGSPGEVESGDGEALSLKRPGPGVHPRGLEGEGGEARRQTRWRGLALQASHGEATISSLAKELEANRNLLSALAGPGISLGFSLTGGDLPVDMAPEDLTRVLVNLVRNASDAMPGGGRIEVALEETPDGLTLSVADSGPGIPEEALEAIFSPGYSTHMTLAEPHRKTAAGRDGWPAQHRGLGLAIVRSLVVAAGGSVWAGNRMSGQNGALGQETGAVFVMQLPVKLAVHSAVQSPVQTEVQAAVQTGVQTDIRAGRTGPRGLHGNWQS